ncbi:MAG: DUF3408 domain-containing protein [Rikenellaceae bacterium]
MKKEEFKFDPENLKELVSQGIRISPYEAQRQEEEQAKRGANEPMPQAIKPIRAKKKIDYESQFMGKSNLGEKKNIYIARSLKDKLSDIVASMRNRELTIGVYVENIITAHFETHKDEINALADSKRTKLL